jgi:hypothetical protein
MQKYYKFQLVNYKHVAYGILLLPTFQGLD